MGLASQAMKTSMRASFGASKWLFSSFYNQIKSLKKGRQSTLQERANLQSSIQNIFSLNKNDERTYLCETKEFILRAFLVIPLLYYFLNDLAPLIPKLINYVISIFIEREEVKIDTIFFGNVEIGSSIITLITIIGIFIGLSLSLKDDNNIYNKITKILLYISVFLLVSIIVLNTLVYSVEENYLMLYLVFFISSRFIDLWVASILLLILIFIPFGILSLLSRNSQNMLFKFEFELLSHFLRPLSVFSLCVFIMSCSVVALDQKPVGPLELIVSQEAIEDVKEIQQQVDTQKADKNKEMWSCYFNKLVSDPTSAPKCFEEEEEGLDSQKVNTHEIVYISKNFDDTILTPKQFRDDSFIFKYKVDDEMIIDNYVCYFYFKNSGTKKKISYYNASESNWKIGDRDVASSNTFSVSDKYITKELFCDGVKEKLTLEIEKSGKEVLEVSFGVDLYVSSDVSYILDIPFINLNEKQYDSRDLALTDLLSNDNNLNQLYNIQNSWTNILNTKVVSLKEKFPILLSQKDSSILIRDFNILIKYSNNHNPIGKLLKIEFSEDNSKTLKLPSYFELQGDIEVTSDKKGIIFNVGIKDIESTELREVIIETLRVDSKATFLIDNNEFVIKIKNENFGNEVEVEEEPDTQEQKEAEEINTDQDNLDNLIII